MLLTYSIDHNLILVGWITRIGAFRAHLIIADHGQGSATVISLIHDHVVRRSPRGSPSRPDLARRIRDVENTRYVARERQRSSAHISHENALPQELLRGEPEHDRRIFECPTCSHEMPMRV
jgi:hypothetical protein